MNGNGKQNVETTAKAGGDDAPLLASFGLVRAIIQAAAKCLNDEDRTPHVVVLDRSELSYAQAVWAAIRGPCDRPDVDVEMALVPDARANSKEAVMLFVKVGG